MKVDSLFALLWHLWLHEPDAETLKQLRELGAVTAPLHVDVEPAELASAYADLFLLNVYPYGTAFTDSWGELNTAEAQAVANLYTKYDYHPPELHEVGAPDHLGLCLGFVAHLEREGNVSEAGVAAFLSNLLSWAPVCCFAAERDPSAQPFYRALAALTRERLLAREWRVTSGDWHHRDPDGEPLNAADETSLRDVVRFLLVPARCGIFLSRARFGAIANALGMQLPFGSRFEVCEWLFASAGESEQVAGLLQALHAESEAWASAYRTWASRYPAWQALSAPWLARAAIMQRTLCAMQEQAELA